MKLGKLSAAAAMVLALAAGSASASVTFSSLVGIANSFGVVVAPDQSFSEFDVEFSVSVPGDGTDEWLAETTVHHTYAFSGNITGASLTLGSGGWGFLDSSDVPQPAAVILRSGSDLITLGYLGIGETDLGNIAVTDSFTLGGAALAMLSAGDVYVQIAPVYGEHFAGLGGEFDFGVLDYSRLTITTDAGGGTAIPEPGTWALSALALAGLAASRRRRR